MSCLKRGLVVPR